MLNGIISYCCDLSLWLYWGAVEINRMCFISRSPSKPLGRKLMDVTDWESVSRNSLSEERLETRSLPTRSPPGTPNQWVHLCSSETPNLMSKELVGCLGSEKENDTYVNCTKGNFTITSLSCFTPKCKEKWAWHILDMFCEFNPSRKSGSHFLCQRFRGRLPH